MNIRSIHNIESLENYYNFLCHIMLIYYLYRSLKDKDESTSLKTLSLLEKLQAVLDEKQFEIPRLVNHNI